jgi:hemolysin III
MLQGIEGHVTAGERKADVLVHLIGLAAAVVGVGIMLVQASRQLPTPSTACLAVYGVGLMVMLACSAIYHMLAAPGWKEVFRRCDHAAIFLKIAGTYTPFAVVNIGGIAGYALLASVWAVAVFGAAAKVLLAHTWDRLAIVLYLALGWSVLTVFPPLIASVPATALVLLGIGGVLYSVGVIFHVWTSLPYHKAIWHLFVLAGSACHFGAVMDAVFG